LHGGEKEMKKKKTLSRMFVILIASILLTMSMSVVNATTSTHISGSHIVSTGVVSPNPAGKSNNAVLLISSTGMYTGGITGSFTGEARWVGHNIGTPELSRNTHNVVTFSSATVMDKTGPLSIMTVGNLEGGTWVIIGGDGELTDLHGHGTYSATDAMFGVVANYEGEIHFDP
jgi:hypothetical protein